MFLRYQFIFRIYTARHVCRMSIILKNKIKFTLKKKKKQEKFSRNFLGYNSNFEWRFELYFNLNNMPTNFIK